MSLVAINGHPEAKKLVLSMPLEVMGGGDNPKIERGSKDELWGIKSCGLHTWRKRVALQACVNWAILH